MAEPMRDDQVGQAFYLETGNELLVTSQDHCGGITAGGRSRGFGGGRHLGCGQRQLLSRVSVRDGPTSLLRSFGSAASRRADSPFAPSGVGEAESARSPSAVGFQTTAGVSKRQEVSESISLG